ncbi:MAG: hypothetical protein IZT56_11950, partial [Bacteroidetes bacterium]|nr:hypothetical protein [Bacteroidota bacterium]
QKIKQIGIKEGRRLDVSKIQEFEIKAWENNQWETIYKGTDVGSFFGVHFDKTISTTKIKIQFNEQNGVEINKVLIYSEQ